MLCTESCGESHHVGPCDALSPAAVPAAQRTKPYLDEASPLHVLPWHLHPRAPWDTGSEAGR